MRINKSIFTAIVALMLIGGWFWYNSGKQAETPEPSKPSKVSITQEKPVVVTRRVSAQPHAAKIKLFGRTEVTREVALKAKTPGTVISTPIKEGRRVVKGTVVCRQEVNARQASVDQAKAQLKSRDVDLVAAQKLVQRGFASETQLLAAQAATDAAKAAVKQAEIELDNINIRAPFTGIYDQHMAEIGDYLAPGQPCGVLLEMDPLTVNIELTESQLALISAGQDATMTLATGETVTGKVNFIAARANPATRTFKAEITVPNPKLALKAGVTATVTLKGNEEFAHLVPGQILGLDPQGRVGVKFLENGIVQFSPTQTIDETSEGIWVTGLPDPVLIITQGQDYVAVNSEAESKGEFE